jgi:hypothetical protein
VELLDFEVSVCRAGRNTMEKYEKIIVLENDIQAQIIADVLKERNIPHVIRSYHDAAYDGLFQSQKGWGHIEAPAKYASEILDIYNELAGRDWST